MHYYIYDNLVQNKKCRRRLSKIETEINNFGLSGERVVANTLNGVDELIKQAIEKNYGPLVVIGDDCSFNSALNALAEYNQKIELGFLPIKSHQILANKLGVDIDNAVISLSRKVMRRIPLAQVNNQYFLANFCCLANTDDIRLPFWRRLLKRKVIELKIQLLVDDKIKVTALASNFTIYYHPEKSKFRISISCIQAKKHLKNKPSVLWAEKIEFSCPENVYCYADNRRIKGSNMQIKVTNRLVNVIVGTRHQFV